MGKKAERKKEQRRKLIQGALITTAFGLFFLILGIWGFVSNRSEFMGYRNSDDIRMVDATVVSADVHSRKGEYDTKEYYWKAKLEFTVDGKTYTGKYEFMSEVKVGDVRSVEAYRTKDGEYRIPEITTDTVYKIYNLLYIISAGLGLAMIIISIVVVLPDKK